MSKKKLLFDAIFIILSAIVLFVLNQYGMLEKYARYALIPMLAVYFIGQLVERKTGGKAR